MPRAGGPAALLIASAIIMMIVVLALYSASTRYYCSYRAARLHAELPIPVKARAL